MHLRSWSPRNYCALRVGRFTTFFELETCLMSEIFRITKLNDVLKFQISKMRLTPAEKGSKILNFGQKSENVVSLNMKIEKSS